MYQKGWKQMTIFFTSSVPGQRNGIVHKNISPGTQKKLFKSIGWNEQQMNLLLQTLTTMLERFKKISGVACNLKIEIDQYQEKTVELTLNEFQFNLTLTRNFEPEDITSKVALGIGQKLTDYCLGRSVPGISHVIQIKPENEISSWILAQTLIFKLLLSFLPNSLFVPNKFCQKRAAALFEELKNNTKKVMINETDLRTSIAVLAMFSVIEEKHGSNQIYTQFVQEFKGKLDGPHGNINRALNHETGLDWFSHHYQEFRQFCENAYNSIKIIS